MTPRRPQASFYDNAKPGGKIENIDVKRDIKFNKNTFMVTSRQAPDVLWLKQFKKTDDIVVAYLRRDKRGYPRQNLLDVGDVIDTFCDIFTSNPKSLGSGARRA